MGAVRHSPTLCLLVDGFPNLRDVPAQIPKADAKNCPSPHQRFLQPWSSAPAFRRNASAAAEPFDTDDPFVQEPIALIFASSDRRNSRMSVSFTRSILPDRPSRRNPRRRRIGRQEGDLGDPPATLRLIKSNDRAPPAFLEGSYRRSGGVLGILTVTRPEISEG